jgi:hypothetical protein
MEPAATFEPILMHHPIRFVAPRSPAFVEDKRLLHADEQHHPFPFGGLVYLLVLADRLLITSFCDPIHP